MKVPKEMLRRLRALESADRTAMNGPGTTEGQIEFRIKVETMLRACHEFGVALPGPENFPAGPLSRLMELLHAKVRYFEQTRSGDPLVHAADFFQAQREELEGKLTPSQREELARRLMRTFEDLESKLHGREGPCAS